MSKNRKIWKAGEAAAIAFVAGMKELNDQAESIGEASQNQVPHLSGTLERSLAVTKQISAGQIQLSYNTPYARRQHEELGYRHENGRKAKYLEDPFRERKEDVVKSVGLAIKIALRKAR